MAGYLMEGSSQSQDVAGVSLYAGAGSPIEGRLTQANIPLWYLGKRPGFDPRIFSALNRVIREVQPQVVHTHLSVLRYAFPVLLRNRVPVAVHTLHNVAEHEADAVGRIVQWFAFRRNVLPVAISQEVAASFERVYRLACRAIVPNCIPVDKYSSRAKRVRWREKEGFDPDSILLTSVARLEPQKNPLMLMRSFAALQDPRARLVLIGEGGLKEQIIAYVQAHGLEHRVRVLGPRKDVAECLSASDVFVLASNWEGSPLAVMEAMAAGLPIISTAVGGVPELVRPGQAGLLVPAGDCAAMTDAMRYLLEDPQKRARMSIAARTRATTTFSLERMVQGYTNLYNRLLKSSGRFTNYQQVSITKPIRG